MAARRTGIPFAAAAFLAAACLSTSLRPCDGKGGGGTGGTSGTPSYSSGSSSYYRPPSSYYRPPSSYYAPGYRPSGYYGNSGYGYSSGSSSKKSGGFWGFLLPVGLIMGFCCCVKKGKYKTPSSSHYNKMQQTNNGFLVGTIKAPYKAQEIPVAPVVGLSNRAFALPGGHSHITRWRGGYTESGRLKHTMYELSFPPLKPGALDGAFTGSGMDDDGGFRVEGVYSLKTGRFIWTELYPSGMKTAVQQQGIAAGASSVIESMRGTYAATTGIHGEMTMTVDIEMGSAGASSYPQHQPPQQQQQQHAAPGGYHHYAPAATAAAAASSGGPVPPHLPTYPSAPQPPPGYPPVGHQQPQQQHHSAPAAPHGAAPPGYPSSGAAPNPYAQQQQQQSSYPPSSGAAPSAPMASLWGGPNRSEDTDVPAPKI